MHLWREFSSRQVAKIKSRLASDFSFSSRLKEEKNFQETIVDLSRSISAYLGIYSDAYNYPAFADELRGHGRAVIGKIFEDLFGNAALEALGQDERKFLGIGAVDMAEPNPELDV